MFTRPFLLSLTYIYAQKEKDGNQTNSSQALHVAHLVHYMQGVQVKPYTFIPLLACFSWLVDINVAIIYFSVFDVSNHSKYVWAWISVRGWNSVCSMESLMLILSDFGSSGMHVHTLAVYQWFPAILQQNLRSVFISKVCESYPTVVSSSVCILASTMTSTTGKTITRQLLPSALATELVLMVVGQQFFEALTRWGSFLSWLPKNSLSGTQSTASQKNHDMNCENGYSLISFKR